MNRMVGRIINIGIFGRPNAGKSSLLNFLTGTQTAIVSDVPGTTADPVSKRMEVPGVGVCNFMDTAGLADGSSLSSLKDEKTISRIQCLDAALFMIPCGSSALPSDLNICALFKRNNIPFLVLLSKADLFDGNKKCQHEAFVNDIIGRLSIGAELLSECSIKDTECRERVFEFLAQVKNDNKKYEEKPMFEGLVGAGDKVVLICPIDSETPVGRLILPQVMAIRQLLDIGAIVTVLQPEQLPDFFGNHANGLSLVVTDSQAFAKVVPFVPANMPLTSFSILLARAKGPFEDYLAGMRFLESLGSGNSCTCEEKSGPEFGPCGTFRVLMLESCTHHATCEDIGRVKIPAVLTKYIKAHCAGVSDVQFTFVSSDNEVPADQQFNLAVQCGGCVVTKRQLLSRLDLLRKRNIPLVNYGMCLALCAGIWRNIGAIFDI